MSVTENSRALSTYRVPRHFLAHPSVPQAHFVRGVEWHSWIARTRVGTVTITRTRRPKGNPQWGKWLYLVDIDFTTGATFRVERGGSLRSAKRIAREAIYHHHQQMRHPKPHYYPDREPSYAPKPERPRQPENRPYPRLAKTV